MTGVWLAWGIACAFAAYNQGIKLGQLPPPYVFVDATLLFGGISLLARWNARVAGLLALGLVLPLILVQLQQWNATPGGGPLMGLIASTATGTGGPTGTEIRQYGKTLGLPVTYGATGPYQTGPFQTFEGGQFQ